MTLPHKAPRLLLTVLVALSGVSGELAQAGSLSHEGRAGERGASSRVPEDQHLDARFGHDHYYYNRGFHYPGHPREGFDVPHGPDHFWYDHGDWYHHDRPDWVVTAAPFGAFVPVLPPFYTTVWFGGAPYYYANDTYYVWNTDQNQYQVVDPPAGIETAATTSAPPSAKLFVYPKNGQSSGQQSTDQYDCYRSAMEQTGYDPTRADGGVSTELSASKRNDYLRADSACLEGRGYSVK